MGKKIDIKEIREEVEKNGWQLLSTEYSNLKSDLEIKCPEGHICFCSLEKFRRKNYQCPTCKTNPYFQGVHTPSKKNGFRILAFDQASITSGWSLFEDGNLIGHGKWSSNGSRSTERIA